MKIDRIDVDLMARMRETPIWLDYVARIRARLLQAERGCLNAGNDEKEIRLAQGEAAALRFVVELPDVMQKEVRRQSDGKNTQ